MSQGFYGFPNILGLLRATNLRLTGKAGATAGAGLAGGTISGAPTAGQFDALDVVPAQDGTLWICTAAGSPGTWAQIGATGATGAAGTGSSYARYTTAAGATMGNAVNTIVNFGTQVWDDGAYVTTGGSWKFTAAVTGRYRVSAHVLLVASTAANLVALVLFKNGSAYAELGRVTHPAVSVAQNDSAWGADTVALTAGDTCDVRCYQQSGAGLALFADATYNAIEISRTG